MIYGILCCLNSLDGVSFSNALSLSQLLIRFLFNFASAYPYWHVGIIDLSGLFIHLLSQKHSLDQEHVELMYSVLTEIIVGGMKSSEMGVLIISMLQKFSISQDSVLVNDVNVAI